MERVKVTLDYQEYEALVKLAERELRPVPDQVRAVLRDRLRKLGLLKKEEVPQCNN